MGIAKTMRTANPEQVEKDQLAEKIHALDYARWDHQAVMKCFNLMRQLNNWLGSCYSEEHRPHAHISAASFGVVLMVNDVVVWNSEEDSENDITLEYCKGKLKEHAMTMLVPFDDVN